MAPSYIAILIPLIVGLAATVATIAIHGVVVHAIIMSLRRDLKRGLLGVRTWMNLTFIVAAILLALGGHLAEIVLWAFVLDAIWRCRRRRRGHLFIRRQLHDFGLRHRVAARNGGCSDRLKRWSEC